GGLPVPRVSTLAAAEPDRPARGRAPPPHPRSRDASLDPAPPPLPARPPRARGAGQLRHRAWRLVRIPARIVSRDRRPPRPPRLPRDRRHAEVHHRTVPRQRGGRRAGALQLLPRGVLGGAMRDVAPIYLPLPPREIAYVKFLFESYEGVAVVRPLDRRAATLVVLVVPDFAPAVDAVVETLVAEGACEVTGPPPDFDGDWLGEGEE